MKLLKKRNPPFIAQFLLKKFFPDKGSYTTLGDLQESFSHIAKTAGLFEAKWWYRKQTVQSIVPLIKYSIYWGMNMFLNYLKMGARNILNDKSYSAINLTGLVIGITTFILISFYVYSEFTFNDFHTKGDRIYRVNKVFTPLAGNKEKHPLTSGKMAGAMAANYPEIEKTVRMVNDYSELLIRKNQTIFELENVLLTEPTFFEIFDFRLLKGNKSSALVEPMSIVLSEDAAYKLFGINDPTGETLIGLNGNKFTVTGIIENVPDNTHITYDVLLSWSSTVPAVGQMSRKWLNNWLTQALHTYLLVKPNTDIQNLEESLQQIITEHLPLKKDQYHLYLQPLNDIYLGSSDLLYNRKNKAGNEDYVRIFLIAGLMILGIASFNFVNLTGARSLRRAKEVGVRKTLGASKKQIVKQFLSETFLVTSVASLIAALFAALLLPYFNQLTNKNYEIDYIDLVLFLFLISVCMSLISGSYPALLLSNIKLTKTLRGQLVLNKSRAVVRKLTVGFQFAISMILIASAIVVYSQLEFILNKNAGFEKDRVVVMPIGKTEISNKAKVFKNELLSNPNIISGAVTSPVPGLGTFSQGISPEGKPEGEDWIASAFRIDDYDLPDTYEMEIVSGRYFSEEFATDTTNGIVINETLAENLGWGNDAVGKKFDVSGEVENGVVIGVIKDFSMTSLHHPVEPLFIYYQPRAQNLSLKVRPENIASTMEFIKKTWEKHDPAYPFEYVFLDETFERLYASEQKMMNIFSLFAGFAIFVSCLGLLGLITYSSQVRKKEIGIRKLLGSSSYSIVFLLSREFLVIVFISVLFSLPVTYLLMSNWLQNFAYRITLDIWLFVLAGLISAGLALITLCYQSFRAATANPVNSLSTE